MFIYLYKINILNIHVYIYIYNRNILNMCTYNICIVINSWVALYTALSIKFCSHPPKRQVPFPRSFHGTTLPTQFFLTINRKIIKNSKEVVHSLVQMSKFYLNMQYSRKLVRNFLS